MRDVNFCFVIRTGTHRSAVLRDPSQDDALKSGAMKALVKATAALSREKDRTLLVEQGSGQGTWLVIEMEGSWTVLLGGSCV